MPTASFADIIEGESIVTLGENLSEQQKQDLLKEMKAPKDATIITVSNAEEHKFLEGIVPKAQNWYESNFLFYDHIHKARFWSHCTFKKH